MFCLALVQRSNSYSAFGEPLTTHVGGGGPRPNRGPDATHVCDRGPSPVYDLSPIHDAGRGRPVASRVGLRAWAKRRAV